MTMTRPTTEQITHETRLLSDVLSGIVTPEAFGAKGDGVTNDTAALQAALDTLKEVRGSPGKTYLVRRVSGTRRCLLWKSGMRWFGCGSVIKLADGEYVPSVGCSVIMSEGTDQSPSTVTMDTSFIGHVDGNSANQTAVPSPGSGNFFTPTVYVNRLARTFWDITISNAHVGGFYCSGGAGQIYDNTLSATVYGSQGNGVWLGGTRWNVPYVSARDTMFVSTNSTQGNPLIVNVTDSTFGRIWAQNFGFGVKFQGDTSNVTIDSIIALQGAGTSATTDRAVKFQGDGPNGHRNIAVGSIVAEGFKKGGLYIFNCDNISIGSYIGRNNGQDAVPENDRVDCYIAQSNEVNIGNLTVDGCGEYPLITQSDSNSIHISQFTCVNTPNATGLWYNKSGFPGNQSNITFGTIAVRNETAGWASSLNHITVGNCNAYIGQASIDVPFSNYTASGTTLISCPGGVGSIRTGPITFRGSRTSGNVALTNNSTTTAVPSAPAMVAANGIDCAPIIKVEPVSNNGNNNSSALMAGRFTASAGNQTTGGITIRHPAIGATGTFYARWTIEGYQAPGDCLETTGESSLVVMTSATAANIADKTNSVNLGSKHAGQLVWDTTNNRLLRSSGTTDVSPWHVVDGSATVTPS
jgi:hypothetical protein